MKNSLSISLLALASSFASGGGAVALATIKPGEAQAGRLSIEEVVLTKAMAKADAFESVLGKKALDRANDEITKEFAQKLIDLHTQCLDELKKMAKDEGITLSLDLDLTQQSVIDYFAQNKSKDWDIDYLSYQIAFHKLVLGAIRDESARGPDSPLKKMAVKQLPQIRDQLKFAERAKRQVEDDRGDDDARD